MVGGNSYGLCWVWFVFVLWSWLVICGGKRMCGVNKGVKLGN